MSYNGTYIGGNPFGAGLNTSGGSDSMPRGAYDRGVNKTTSLNLSTNTLTNSYQYTGTGRAIIYGVCAANVDGTNEVNISMAVNDFSAGADVYVTRNIPIPADTSIEIIKRPIVLMPNDRLKFQASSVNDVQLITRYVEFDSNTNLFNNLYKATAGAVTPLFPTMYTELNTNGSVIESLTLMCS